MVYYVIVGRILSLQVGCVGVLASSDMQCHRLGYGAVRIHLCPGIFCLCVLPILRSVRPLCRVCCIILCRISCSRIAAAFGALAGHDERTGHCQCQQKSPCFRPFLFHSITSLLLYKS